MPLKEYFRYFKYFKYFSVMASDELTKNIRFDSPETKRELGAMAARADQDLKTFIGNLLAVIAEKREFSSIKWLLTQAKNRKPND